MAKPNLISSLLSLSIILSVSRQALAVDYSITNNAANTAGGMIFANQIGDDFTQKTLSDATNFIWQTFQETSETDRKPIDHVSLIIVPSLSGAVAVTSNNQIQYSAGSIANDHSGQLKIGFAGVIYHEMTHVWQWDGNGQVYQQNRGGLIEGIADFVRLKAGYTPSSGWVEPGGGDHWYDGYSVTARFLDYCDGLMPGFVAQLNKKMRDGYSDGFFQDLLGKSVDQLWSDYKAKYGNN